jgi:Flp pilus assembly protein TadD
VEKNTAKVDRLYTDIEWALSQGLPAGEVVPMIERLMRCADPKSLHANYARRQLAELIVREEPFRAARLARDALQIDPDDDRAHAVLGLANMLMGHFRVAERSYRRALSLVPHCPWYSHNLGHLLDVALGRPHEALALLRLSRRALPHEPEIASSYAHALLKCGDRAGAHRELLNALDGDAHRANQILAQWTPLDGSTLSTSGT